MQNTTTIQGIKSFYPLVLISSGGKVDFDNITSLICLLGSKVEMLNLSYSKWINISCTYVVTMFRLDCTQCDQGTYSLQRGNTTGLIPVHPFSYLPCPYGAKCFTTIKSKPVFWGYLSNKNMQSSEFTRCPGLLFWSCAKNHQHDGYNTCQGKREVWICSGCSPG